MPPTFDSFAKTGFKDALAYDAHRPSYPPEAVKKLVGLLKVDVGGPYRIVDLAAGTGKFTELIAAHPGDWEIIAVEPHPQMREVLKKKDLERVRVVDGMASEMNAVSNGWADGVVVAQAFHWFANIDTLREIHRVLRPGGVLFLVWNEEDYNSRTIWTPATTWEKEIRDIIWIFDDKQHRFRDTSWSEVFGDTNQAPNNDDNTTSRGSGSRDGTGNLFSMPLQDATIKWTERLTKEALWDRISTLSFIVSLSDHERNTIKEKVFETFSAGRDRDTESRTDDDDDDDDGKLTIHARTHVIWTTTTTSVPKDLCKE